MKKEGFILRPGYSWILQHVDHEGEECLIWPFSTITPGYGVFAIKRKAITAHRWMCEFTHGKPPTPQHQASHSCGNRRCVNPQHISWKTRSANQRDRKVHGTNNKSRTKITAQQAAQIRQLKGVETSVETAARYGVTESNVRAIQSGKTWRKPLNYLSHEQVTVIRQLGYSKTLQQIAEQVGTTRDIVDKIRKGKSYRFVGERA